MSLKPGDRVAAYEVLGPLGRGGMGEVYRGHDRRLGRDVALKILPSAFAEDPERLARFEREARLLASLNHPHIGSIYGIEEADGVRALVLELIEGPTLAGRLSQGRLSLDEALRLARQIADALEAAHERGIVHRDLKPANVKLTQDGTVKVLDFGLAKAIGRPVADPDESATMTAAGTRAGLILGTAAYMSPEQARAQPVDRRTDIWAFGCVLFEMLTGRRAFTGTTVSDVIAAVLERQPEWARLPSGTPPALGRLLRRCLMKDPKQRFHDMADVRIGLDDALVADAGEPREPSTSKHVSGALMALAAMALASAVLAVWS